MVSFLLRRSGIAVGLVADRLQWVPDTIYQVGVGLLGKEIEVFQEAWPKCKLIGFEANPNSVESVRDEYPGELHAVAVGDYEGTVTLHVKPRHADGSSIRSFRDDIDHYDLEVPISTLDLLVPDGPPTTKTMLWIDCEGAENAVLRGAANFLRKVELVNVEMTAKPYGEDWSSHLEVHNQLIDEGFRRQWIHTQRITSGQVDVIYVRPNIFQASFCCCPCELGEQSCE